MFPGEFASSGDLGANPACQTWEEAAAQKLKAGGLDRAVACVRGERGLCSPWAAFPDAFHPVLFPHSFDFCPDEIALQWALALTRTVPERAAAWLSVPGPRCLGAALLEALCGSLSPTLCNLSLPGWHLGHSCLVPVMSMATSPLGPVRQWLSNLRQPCHACHSTYPPHKARFPPFYRSGPSAWNFPSPPSRPGSVGITFCAQTLVESGAIVTHA